MSSILDALEKLEGNRVEPRSTRLLAVEAPVRRTVPWLATFVVTTAFVAGVAVTGALVQPAVEPPPPSAPVTRAPVVPARRPTRAPAPAPATLPSTRTAAPVPAPPNGDTPLIRSTLPPPLLPIAAVDPMPEATMPALAPREEDPPSVRSVTDGPIRVSFLLHSATPARRSVALAIEGQSLVTLHEGEHHGDVEVLRILPDRVELRYKGEVVTIPARG